MRHTPETCLNTAYDDWNIFEASPNQIAVHDCRVVWSFVWHAAGCIGIRLTVFFGHIVVIDHRIHIAGGHQKTKARCAKHGNTVILFPVWLGDDADMIPMCLKQPCDDRMSKGRMIYISIPRDIDKIQLPYLTDNY